jgi:hypothetical protein
MVYRNNVYGFTLSLPKSWKAYKTIVERREREVTDDATDADRKNKSYVVITIRHPLWRKADRRQDIPIMVFTRTQWPLVEKWKLIFTAAPFPPSVLGQNRKYVFALPPDTTLRPLQGLKKSRQSFRANLFMRSDQSTIFGSRCDAP